LFILGKVQMGNTLEQAKQYIEENEKGWEEEKRQIAIRMRQADKDEYEEMMDSERVDLQDHLDHLNEDLDLIRDSVVDMEHDKNVSQQQKRSMYQLLEKGERLYAEISKFLDVHLAPSKYELELEREEMQEQEPGEMQGRRKARRSSAKKRHSKRRSSAKKHHSKRRSAAKKRHSKRRSSAKQKEMGCVAQPGKKYTSRSSPAYPANQCCGRIMMGKDGEYKSMKNKNGVCVWKRI